MSDKCCQDASQIWSDRSITKFKSANGFLLEGLNVNICKIYANKKHYLANPIGRFVRKSLKKVDVSGAGGRFLAFRAAFF